MSHSNTCLLLENVSKQFLSNPKEKAVIALDNISFSVQKGEFVCLLGRSGCGKSTLLSILAGLEQADKGKVLLDGQPIIGPGYQRMLMFQDPALFPWLDVLDNVLYGLKLVPELSPSERINIADEYLNLVGLHKFRRFRIHELSGGMRQRVALARALAPDPEILLMDEPFSALDAMTREQLYADMQRIWAETHKTVIMVTHNVREAVCLGTRAMIMRSPGHIIQDENITLPYPRSMNDPQLANTANHIASFLQNAEEEHQEC